MANEVLLVEPGPITRITLNRPDKLNTYNHELGSALVEALERERLRAEVRVIVIAGAGRAFCAGDDLTDYSFPDGYDTNDPLTAVDLTPYNRIQLAIRRVPKPVITQVHGYCLGAGMDTVLASDYAIADPDARLGLVFARQAIAGGMVLTPRHVGLKRATRLLFEGEMLSAADALELGLISRVAEPGRLASEVDDLAHRLAEGPTRVYGYVKEGLNRAFFSGMEDEVRFLSFMYSFASQTADGREAMKAWEEKREPRYTGR